MRAFAIAVAAGVLIASSGCRYSVPASIRTTQAAVTDDQSITLGEIERDMAAAATQPEEQRSAEQLRCGRRAIDCLRRTEASNWVVRCWMAGTDPRAQPQAQD